MSIAMPRQIGRSLRACIGGLLLLPLAAQANFGFESDLTNWTTYETVTIDTGGDYFTDSPSFVWTVNPHETKMAVLIPSGASGAFTSVADALGLSTASRTYLTTQFPNTTNFAYIQRDVVLTAGQEFTMAWNYVSTDYVPFNDGSFVSLVNLTDPANVPTVYGVAAEVAILGATNPGTGNYSTGSYGSTGWQTATFRAATAGTYRLGFAVFNLTDTILPPYLFVDQEPGATFLNGQPFAPIDPDVNAPPPAGPVNGQCGSASGQSFVEPPVSGLCSAGTASSVTAGSSSFGWTCQGLSGGSDQVCSASNAAAAEPIPVPTLTEWGLLLLSGLLAVLGLRGARRAGWHGGHGA